MDAEFVDQIDDELAAACADAGVDRETVKIWVFDCDPFVSSAPASVHYGPDWRVYGGAPIFNDRSRVEANSSDAIRKHRIGVCAGIDPGNPVAFTAVAGLIRHEVEHALQFGGADARGLKNLDGFADEIADAIDKPGEVGAYRSKPTEASANRAAANYLCQRYPRHRAALSGGKFAPFAARPEPGIAPDQIGRLTVEWIDERKHLVDKARLFGEAASWKELLEREMPGASRWLS